MKSSPLSIARLIVIVLTILILSGCALGGCGRSEKILTIGPDGGEYDLYQDLSLFVPANAVNEELEITIREIASEDVEALRGLGEDADSELLTAFEVLPSGQSFFRPLQIRLKDVDAEGGSLPLVYSLDLENQSLQLAEVRSDYDPDTGDLVLFLDHFSSYAAYREKGYISEECIQNPCRCGRISIVQSDAYNICSQDECQVSESEVSVTYHECGGETHNLLMREISASCQPRMTIYPQQAVIPVESSTAVHVELGLSCAPFKGEDVFYTADQLGTVDPLQTLSGDDGKTQTTFTAGEEEGTSVVTAEAFGSYYLLEITVNDQSEYGIEKFYELEESTTIEIGGIRGTFQAQFDDCTELICVENYQVTLTFSVDEINWEEETWTGTAEISQSGNVVPSAEGWVVDDFTIVPREEITFTGNADQEAGILDLWSLGAINWPSLNEEYVTFSFVFSEAADLALPGNIAGFVKDHTGLEQLKSFTFNVDGSDTPQSGDCYMIVTGEDPFLSGTYTLTLEY